VFAASITIADRAARKQGWHPYGRTSWITPDGNEVSFVCFEEQLAVLDRHATIYFVGELSPRVRRLTINWAKLQVYFVKKGPAATSGAEVCSPQNYLHSVMVCIAVSASP
jgi:hypothetical protein